MQKPTVRARPCWRPDTAGLMFALIKNSRRTGVFRLALTLTEAVEPGVLQAALLRIIGRFPSFRVRMRRGFFWNYFTENPEPPQIAPDGANPCRQFKTRREHGYPFRVLYQADTIIVEFFHILTDGSGGLAFLQALAAEYLRLRGATGEAGEGPPAAGPDPEEAEDAYQRYYQPAPSLPRVSPAFHLTGTPEPDGLYHLVTGSIPLASLRAAAKTFDATITEFLTAVYLDLLQQMQRASLKPGRRRPIRVFVPVNLRRFFPSRTMLNFSSFFLVEIDPRRMDYSFAQIVEIAKRTLRLEANAMQLKSHIKRYIGLVRNPLVAFTPFFVKRLLAGFLYNWQGENRFSGSLTNLTYVTLPLELAPHIRRLIVASCPNTQNTCRCGVLGCGDYVHLTIGRTTKENEFERRFFAALKRFGLPLEIVAYPSSAAEAPTYGSAAPSDGAAAARA